jgi:hypothetical protein
MAARAAIDVDDDLNPWQMCPQRSRVDPALVSLGRLSSGDEPSVSAPRCSTSSRPSRIWSSDSVSALRPKRCRCSSLMIWRSRSFRTRLASSIAFSVSGSSGSALFGITELCDDLPGSFTSPQDKSSTWLNRRRLLARLMNAPPIKPLKQCRQLCR